MCARAICHTPNAICSCESGANRASGSALRRMSSIGGGRANNRVVYTNVCVCGWVRRYGFITLSCGLTPRQYTTHTLEGCHSPNTYNNPSTCIIHCSVNTPSQPDIQLAALNTANDIFWSPVISKHTPYSHKSTQWKNAREPSIHIRTHTHTHTIFPRHSGLA